MALVWYSPAWGLTQLWVILGLLGIANSIVVGAVFLGPESGRIGRLWDERGANDPEVQRRIRRIFAISRNDLTVLLLVVVDMVVSRGRRFSGVAEVTDTPLMSSGRSMEMAPSGRP